MNTLGTRKLRRGGLRDLVPINDLGGLFRDRKANFRLLWRLKRGLSAGAWNALMRGLQHAGASSGLGTVSAARYLELDPQGASSAGNFAPGMGK